MALHSAAAGETAAIGEHPGATAAGHGLVVLAAVITEAEVVHRALARRQHPQGAEQGIGHRLRSLHIAAHHRRGEGGMQQATERHHQVDRLEAAGIERDRLRHQHPKHVEHHRLGDRQRGVEITALLGGGAAEVHPHPPLPVVGLDRHHNARAVVEFHGMTTGTEPIDHRPHRLGGVALHIPHRGHHIGGSLLGHEAMELGLSKPVGGHLGL